MKNKIRKSSIIILLLCSGCSSNIRVRTFFTPEDIIKGLAGTVYSHAEQTAIYERDNNMPYYKGWPVLE
tara:strand:+ start:2408 stop:2614 length:207 start_codon:yes stop_codon:yes gene_type:complete